MAGILGGVGGDQLLSMLTGAAAPAARGGLDMLSILSSVGGAGIGGAVIMVIVGLVKAQMSKSALASSRTPQTGGPEIPYECRRRKRT